MNGSGRITNFFIATEDNDFHPPILSYKAFVVYGTIMLLLRLLLGTLPTQGAAVESQTLMTLINGERVQRNLNALLTDGRLLAAATEKSQDMIDRDFFAHIDPDGSYVWPRIERAGYKPHRILGENLAVDFATAEGVINAWLDSPTHRENLLHAEFFDQGLSALYGDFQGRFTNLTTSLFGTLAVVATPPPQVKAEKPLYQTPKPTYQNPYATPLINPEPGPPKIVDYPTIIKNPTGTAPEEISKNSSENKQIQRLTYPSVFEMSRIISTLLGIVLLIILAVDTVIIFTHEKRLARAHSSYHFFGFFPIVLISILIWWW